ncbi:MAG: undecaprenyl-diphosphate phosphatase [Methanoregula sp.]|jgi:undecaprenyl-diphosphatase
MLHEITVLEALFLGLLQGFTEWLPISSSGHLVIFQALLGIDVPPDFDIIIMAGTVAALILYFRKKIYSLFRGVLAGDRSAMMYVALVILAGFPTAVIGFDFRIFFKSLFSQPFIVSLLLIVTGVFLFIASRKKDTTGEVSPLSALLIGIAQGIAVAPGISRSGSTIGTALLMGIKPKEAAEFSFLIGIPAMIIASGLTYMEGPASGIGFLPMIVAVIAAFLAGYASIGLFMKVFEQNRLYYFAVYCVVAGSVFAIVTHLMGY